MNQFFDFFLHSFARSSLLLWLSVMFSYSSCWIIGCSEYSHVDRVCGFTGDLVDARSGGAVLQLCWGWALLPASLALRQTLTHLPTCCGSVCVLGVSVNSSLPCWSEAGAAETGAAATHRAA